MKLKIESFTTLTGWVINYPSIIALNEFMRYVSCLENETSLLVKFDSKDTVKTLIKTFTAVDVTDYETLVFNIWSETKGKQTYGRNIESDFNYKIKINDTDEYLLPVYNTFTDVNINIKDVTTIDRIEITALHKDTDNIILSEMIAEYEEMPIDLLEEMKNHIEFYLERKIGKGLLLGKISATVGDTQINTSDYNYIDRYSVILIDDGNNYEVHQLKEIDDNSSIANLNDNYEGPTIKNNYIDADIYLMFPVYINPDERDVRLPGICLWGIAPEPIFRTGKLDRFIESYKTDGSMTERIEGQIWKYFILIDCEARASSLIAIMSKAVRDFCGNRILWINGRKHELFFNQTPVETRAMEGIDIIPKIQYQINVEVIEQIAPAENLVKTDSVDININIGGE